MQVLIDAPFANNLVINQHKLYSFSLSKSKQIRLFFSISNTFILNNE